MEHNTTDKAAILAGVYLQNRSEHFIEAPYRNEAAKRKSVCEVAMQEMEAYLPAQNTVESEIEAKELAAIIDAFLDTLSVENRIIFMRRYAYFDTYAEIANRVGLSEKNVSVRLARIRRKMKKHLMERKVFV